MPTGATRRFRSPAALRTTPFRRATSRPRSRPRATPRPSRSPARRIPGSGGNRAPGAFTRNRRKIEIQPGSFNEIPAGTYDLIVPPTLDLEESLRKIPEISIAKGESLTLEIMVGKEGVTVAGEDRGSETAEEK